MDKIKVIIWGFGAMGSGMAEMLLGKKGVEIIGVCDSHPDRKGKVMLSILEKHGNISSSDINNINNTEILIKEKIEDIVSPDCADVVLLATDSFTKKAYDKIVYLLKNKLNVISTAEEMAYPSASEPELTKLMDKIAKENGVSVLGTGINPGLIMDLLVVLMTGASIDVEHIKAERVNSLSPFGPAVMEEQGVGLTKQAFINGVKDGSLAGHVGFNESVGMITDAIGWKLSNSVKQTQEPIITTVPRKTKYIEVEAGNVAGCSMNGYGYVNEELKVEMVHPQQIEPESEGIKTGDYVTIKGTPNINLSIKPEVPGGIGTIAMCVNMIPQIINASPGLKTMLDLPVPRAIMGDMRERIDR
jgi:2,4-diaminopentanoate dehydrogenase